MGRALRFASRDHRGAVKIEGTDRIRVLEPLFAFAKKLTVWYDETAQTSAWDPPSLTLRVGFQNATYQAHSVPVQVGEATLVALAMRHTPRSLAVVPSHASYSMR